MKKKNDQKIVSFLQLSGIYLSIQNNYFPFRNIYIYNDTSDKENILSDLKFETNHYPSIHTFEI